MPYRSCGSHPHALRVSSDDTGDRIEGPVEGLIHVSELVDRRIGHPKEVVREGDLLPLKIVRIERDRHRLDLSLRRARDEPKVTRSTFTSPRSTLRTRRSR